MKWITKPRPRSSHNHCDFDPLGTMILHAVLIAMIIVSFAGLACLVRAAINQNVEPQMNADVRR